METFAECLKECKSKTVVGEWVCYFIRSQVSLKTYVGMTNNFPRRISQHCGVIIKGGAKRTRSGRPWVPVLVVKGFDSKIQAMQFEWMWHHPTPRKCGIKGCLEALNMTLNREKWTNNSSDASTIPLRIRWFDETLREKYKSLFQLPFYVTFEESDIDVYEFDDNDIDFTAQRDTQ